MDDNVKESIITRVTTGITFLNIDNSLYSCHVPSNEQRALSELVYRETLENSKFNDLMNREQLKEYLNFKGIWTADNEEQIKKLNDFLENLKIEIYEAHFDDRKVNQIRKRIVSTRNLINKSHIRKLSLDHVTLESHAETTRDEFLTAITIKDSNNNYVYSYENWSTSDAYVLKRFLNDAANNIIQTEEYREIARTEPFRSRWSMMKENTFGNSFHTNDQLALMMYSRMYDNVYEHPEKPIDKVIEDNDMLDGWFAKERKKAEEDRKKKDLENSVSGRHDDKAGELFVMANNKQAANKVRNVNDLHSRIRMKQRESAIQERNIVEEGQLPDVQMELRSEAMKQMADRFKK